MAPRGRPRLTRAEYEERLEAYCRRYSVCATAAGIPPFPAGRRETDQHREWMSLYKAHERLSRASGAAAPASPDGPSSCGVCGRAVALGQGSATHRSAVVHLSCHQVVALAEPLGPAGVDRLRAYLWPPPPKRSPTRRRKQAS